VIAEAMLRGLPVVATNWSGNIDFLTSANGEPVTYSLVPAFDPQGTYDEPSSLWAEADIADAAAKLMMLRDNPAKASSIGNLAASDASRIFGTVSYVNKLEELLGDGIRDTARPKESRSEFT
jgi:hypothetical protein